mmetsp:Transcript_19807/g.51156  ORF Transcript_19807/g.51156 Transcript_19807/m.51156 type:complete len:323 (+) Transcript_19807:204-1172(+)
MPWIPRARSSSRRGAPAPRLVRTPTRTRTRTVSCPVLSWRAPSARGELAVVGERARQLIEEYALELCEEAELDDGHHEEGRAVSRLEGRREAKGAHGVQPARHGADGVEELAVEHMHQAEAWIVRPRLHGARVPKHCAHSARRVLRRLDRAQNLAQHGGVADTRAWQLVLSKPRGHRARREMELLAQLAVDGGELPRVGHGHEQVRRAVVRLVSRGEAGRLNRSQAARHSVDACCKRWAKEAHQPAFGVGQVGEDVLDVQKESHQRQRPSGMLGDAIDTLLERRHIRLAKAHAGARRRPVRAKPAQQARAAARHGVRHDHVI